METQNEINGRKMKFSDMPDNIKQIIRKNKKLKIKLILESILKQKIIW